VGSPGFEPGSLRSKHTALPLSYEPHRMVVFGENGAGQYNSKAVLNG
jgi:hypothetical protein